MTQTEKMRALLKEARDALVRAENRMMHPPQQVPNAIQRIDAALAELANEWQPHEDPARTAYVVQIERERDEARAEVEHWKAAAKQHAENHTAAVEAFHDASRLRSIIQQARIKAEDERDEARAEVERLKSDSSWGALRRLDDEWRTESSAAFKRGAEAMREAAKAACKPVLRSMASRSEIAEAIRALPIPEDKP
jgi:hypothetical protein